MSYAPEVVVKTTLEAQRLSIMSALSARQVDIPKMVDAALDAALKDDALVADIRRQVYEQMEATLREEIKRAVNRAFWNDEMRARIANLIRDGLSTKPSPGSET